MLAHNANCFVIMSIKNRKKRKKKKKENKRKQSTMSTNQAKLHEIKSKMNEIKDVSEELWTEFQRLDKEYKTLYDKCMRIRHKDLCTGDCESYEFKGPSGASEFGCQVSRIRSAARNEAKKRWQDSEK